MIESILTQANLRTRTLFERYQSIADDVTAFIMACAESGEVELAQPVIEKKREDNRILMEETYRCLIPLEQLLQENQADEIEVLTDSEDDVEQKNDDE